jgi:hypothetical protein
VKRIKDRPNTALLICLLVMFVAHPVSAALARPGARYVLDAIFFLVLLLALNAERGRISFRSRTLYVVIAVAVMRTIITIHPGELSAGLYRTLLITTEIATGVLVISICVVLLRNIGRATRVKPDTIASACAVYILLTLAFSSFYIAAWVHEPGGSAFNGIPVPWNERERLEESVLQMWGQTFNYFSVVTQTTLGYGDITPNTPITRGLVMVQTIVGQLYISILLALLVAIWLSQRRLDDDPA